MGRSPCCEKAHTNKGAWTKEEDQRLIDYIRLHGEGCWRSLPKSAGLFRCGKSCRLRWINYLRPDLKRGNFTPDEDDLIIKLHSLLGNKWSLIAGRLPGRTDNEIKNYWNTHIKRKLISRGLDPLTHRPVKSAASTVTPAVAISPPAVVSQTIDFKKGYLEEPSSKIRSTDSNEGGGTCISGTTTDDAHIHRVVGKAHELDLELSIGLSSFQTDQARNSPTASSADSKVVGQGPFLLFQAGNVAAQYEGSKGGVSVCLCCELGFQTKEAQGCSNCQTTNKVTDSFRFIKALGL